MGLFDRNDYGRDYGGGDRSLGDRMRGAWNRFEQRFGAGAHRHDYDGDLQGRDVSYGPGMYRSGGGTWRGRQDGWGSQERGHPVNDRGNPENYGPASFAYRGLDDAWGTARNRGAHDTQWDWRAAGGNRYDQDMGPRGGSMHGRERHDYDRGFFGGRDRHDYDRGFMGQMRVGHGYDRDMNARGGYDRDFGRDRMRTDAGDPFGDRQNRTPFRVLRGSFDGEQGDRGWFNRSEVNGVDQNDVHARGWGHGIGDDPVYRPEDFRGRDQGRGRGGPF